MADGDFKGLRGNLWIENDRIYFIGKDLRTHLVELLDGKWNADFDICNFGDVTVTIQQHKREENK